MIPQLLGLDEVRDPNRIGCQNLNANLCMLPLYDSVVDVLNSQSQLVLVVARYLLTMNFC